ncbi:SMP-30/gluconolactonase/LRE family protein, partial [Aphanothece microscopica]|uniref:SMP-30/gluconolactonase/LRE family protein n=1 Tax=Aphanothece microscopica TaxID=1049561 RepID=UPI0039852951
GEAGGIGAATEGRGEFAEGGMDGMRCDTEGNLYITRYGLGQVAVVSPAGKQISTITTIGKNVSNICFGGRKGKNCYITLQDRGCLETFKVKTPGREWVMMREYIGKR